MDASSSKSTVKRRNSIFYDEPLPNHLTSLINSTSQNRLNHHESSSTSSSMFAVPTSYTLSLPRKSSSRVVKTSDNGSTDIRSNLSSECVAYCRKELLTRGPSSKSSDKRSSGADSSCSSSILNRETQVSVDYNNSLTAGKRTDALKSSVLKSFDKILYHQDEDDDERNSAWKSNSPSDPHPKCYSSESDEQNQHPNHLITSPAAVSNIIIGDGLETTSHVSLSEEKSEHQQITKSTPEDNSDDVTRTKVFNRDHNLKTPSASVSPSDPNSVSTPVASASGSSSSSSSSPVFKSDHHFIAPVLSGKKEAAPSESSVGIKSSSSSASGSSLLNQLKAWTTDRKLIRGRLKKLTAKCKYSVTSGNHNNPNNQHNHSGISESSSSPASASTATPKTPESSKNLTSTGIGSSSIGTTPSSSAVTKSASSVTRTSSVSSSSTSSLSISSRKKQENSDSTKHMSSQHHNPHHHMSINAWKRLSLLSFPSIFDSGSSSGSRESHATNHHHHLNQKSISEDSSGEENSASSQASSSSATNSTRDSGFSPDSGSQAGSEGTIDSQVIQMMSHSSTSSQSGPVKSQISQGSQTESEIEEAKLIEELDQSMKHVETKFQLDKRIFEPIALSLTKDSRGELGIYVTGKSDEEGKMKYIVADFEANGPAER